MEIVIIIGAVAVLVNVISTLVRYNAAPLSTPQTIEQPTQSKTKTKKKT